MYMYIRILSGENWLENICNILPGEMLFIVENICNMLHGKILFVLFDRINKIIFMVLLTKFLLIFY